MFLGLRGSEINAKSAFSCALGMGRLVVEGWDADGLGGVGRIEVFEVPSREQNPSGLGDGLASLGIDGEIFSSISVDRNEQMKIHKLCTYPG